ncbi:MAG: DNA replication and repair protein RecF [Akkermansiaceae bacterium]|nr:DNA replication and repair protein RecF [Akkermansiaceae bacterium]
MLQAIRLHNFRCHSALAWEPPVRGALILGDNAQGKTSLLEAICFGLRLFSPRTSHIGALVRHGTRRFGLLLRLMSGTRRIIWEEGRLRTRLDDVPCRGSAEFLASSPSVVWFGNEDMALVRNGAEARRRHIDFLGVQWHPAYRREWSLYRRTLKSRNLLLKQRRCDTAALRSYTCLLAASGERITQMRSRLADLLAPHLYASQKAIAGQSESVELQYAPSNSRPLAEALEASMEEDLRCGFTRFGPHRDDFKLMIQGVSAGEFGSEGQQRTLTLALQLAHASLLREETGVSPVLLVDDVFGELDISRRRAFLSALPADSPLFITTTHDSWRTAPMDNSLERYRLADGVLTHL